VTETRFVQANGIRFAYLEEGEGPLVLLLHGFPDTAHSWDDVRPRIAKKGFRAVSPFMRGYHPTEVPTRDADGRTIGEDTLALITALGADKAIVVGHDWGASAAYTAAALAGDRIERMFIVGIPHPNAIQPTLAKVWGVRHFFAYKLPGASKRFAANDFAALPAIYKRWSPAWSPPASEFDAVRASFSNAASLEAAMGYYRQLPLVPPDYLKKKIDVPTVCFAGTDDPIVPVSDYHRAKRMFTSAYAVEEMPGGHFMHREHPQIFADKLLARL
jgi:pimeloyl-ACP methyl ester carboxylesterase